MRQQETERVVSTNTNMNAIISRNIRLRLPTRPILERQRTTGDNAATNNTAAAASASAAHRAWICSLLQVALDVANDPMLTDDDGDSSDDLEGSEIGEVSEGLRQ
jgi:hypothetical protein